MSETPRRSPAFQKNHEPILGALRDALPKRSRVLEIGSGSGEHAAWFAGQLPDVTWTPSDRGERADWAQAWREHVELENLRAPLELDLAAPSWDLADQYDAVVAINVVHISWSGAARALFAHAAAALRPGGVVYVYGPYRYDDRPLEPSNVSFDGWLKGLDPDFGVRRFAEVDARAQAEGFALAEDRAMPSNNRSIWWTKDLDARSVRR